MNDQNIKKSEISIKKATLITACSKYSNVVFMMIANAVLARILSVEEYGVLAIITVFVTFFQLFADMGFSSGVIQNKELDSNDLNNIFSFTVFLGIGLGILFIFVSFIIAKVYENRVFIPIGLYLSIAIIFNTMNMIPNAKLMRDKKFVLVALRNIIVYIISYSIAIVMAIKGFSYYSLVAQSVIAAMLNFFWNYSTVKFKFKVHFKIESIKKIFSYSVYNFLYEFVNYFGRNLDNILTGKYMGSEVLGYYNKAYQLMLYPVNYLTNVITPVLHPILSDYQNNKEYIYKKYIRVLKCLSLIGVFASIICVFCSKEIVLILYGPKWVSTISCIKILGASVWFQMITSTCTSIFKSLGKSRLRFNSGVLYAIIQIVMVVIGVSSKNIITLSYFVAMSFVIRFIVEHYFLIKKGFGMPLISFIKVFLPEIGLAILMSLTYLIINKYIIIDNCVVSFVIKGFIGGIVYIIGMHITAQDAYIYSLFKPSKRKSKK